MGRDSSGPTETSPRTSIPRGQGRSHGRQPWYQLATARDNCTHYSCGSEHPPRPRRIAVEGEPHDAAEQRGGREQHPVTTLLCLADRAAQGLERITQVLQHGFNLCACPTLVLQRGQQVERLAAGQVGRGRKALRQIGQRAACARLAGSAAETAAAVAAAAEETTKSRRVIDMA